MLNRDRLVKSSRIVVRIASLANRFLLLAFVVLLLLSWIFSPQFAAWLAQSTPERDVLSKMTGMRWEILLGIAMSLATDRLFAALAQVIASASAGDPFILTNARRLQTIGWALLALQLLDFPAALLGRFYPSLGSAAPSGTVTIGPFSVGGWISVLMVFVLSRVFAAGSEMREELEGTV